MMQHIVCFSFSVYVLHPPNGKQKKTAHSPCIRTNRCLGSAVPPKLSSKDHLYCLQQDRHGLTRRHTDHLLGMPFGSRLRSVIRRNASAGFPLSPAHCAKRLPVTSLHQGHFYLMQYLYHPHFILSSVFLNFPKILNRFCIYNLIFLQFSLVLFSFARAIFRKIRAGAFQGGPFVL